MGMKVPQEQKLLEHSLFTPQERKFLHF